jgi:hypothetical protein
MRNRKSIDALSLGVFIVAIGIVIAAFWNRPPGIDKTIPSEIGKTLARHALDVLPSGGGVIVIARDTEVYPQPAMDVTLSALQEEITRAGVTVTTKLIQLDPLRPAEVPPGDFYEAIRRAKDNKVIVSLLGPPVLEAEQRAKLNDAKPRIVGLCTGNLAEQSDLRGLLQEGLMTAALVNRPQTNAGGVAGKQTFGELYAVLQKDGFDR